MMKKASLRPWMLQDKFKDFKFSKGEFEKEFSSVLSLVRDGYSSQLTSFASQIGKAEILPSKDGRSTGCKTSAGQAQGGPSSQDNQERSGYQGQPFSQRGYRGAGGRRNPRGASYYRGRARGGSSLVAREPTSPCKLCEESKHFMSDFPKYTTPKTKRDRLLALGKYQDCSYNEHKNKCELSRDCRRCNAAKHLDFLCTYQDEPAKNS
ncbi:unnamed protein product [Meganyctiphanes norvegica]|uniref:Gag protein n=1 Tax=Meganyctiphanes norvegica TaxID=48144 RepID=A0AAV2S6C3_MEGNR